MKNKLFGIVAIAASIVFTTLSLTACDNSAGGSNNPNNPNGPGTETGSKLTVTGLPNGGTYAAYVFAAGTDISTYTAIANAYSAGSYQAVGSVSSGNVFTLYGWNGASQTGAWTGSGSRPVLLLDSSGNISSAENPMYRYATVSFSNGSGTAAFNGFTAVVYGGGGPGPNPGTGGTLTINNLPAGADYAVEVYNYSGTISDALGWAAASANIIAVGEGTTSSSVSLYAASTASAFDGTGSYMVALYTTSVPITVLYQTGVSFTDGSAAIDYAALTDLFGNATGPGGNTKGKLTINNFPAGSSLGITVYDYDGEITCLTDISTVQMNLSNTLAASVGMATSSPVSLQKFSNPLSSFDGTGTYLVLFASITPMSSWYAEQVEFTDGNAELDFNEAGLTSDLPLTAGGGGNTEVTAGTMTSYYADSISFKMAAIPGRIPFPTGTDDSGSAIITDSYQMGETEVTWEMWNTVQTWAVTKGYSISAGQRGSSGSGSDQQPVTMVSWYDSIVWCNALTEYWNEKTGANLATVYNSGGNPIRDAGNTSALNGVTPNATATGFRLPTSNEWELAARWRNDETNTVAGYSNPWFTKGDSASGATADYTNSTATNNVALSQANSSSTAVVKSKTPNALGLYDMSGNVWEWCFDMDAYSFHVVRGGAWRDEIEYTRVGVVHSIRPSETLGHYGFRIVRTGYKAGEIAPPNNCTVTFDSNGGSTVSPVTVVEGDKISAPTVPTKINFIFGGWYKESGLSNQWNFASDTVTGNITLYAKWVDVRTVTFNSNGGSTVNPVTVEPGGKITAPTVPTKTNCTFGGWYRESGLSNQWNFATDTVTGNITLYAKWTCTVTFNAYNGTTNTTQTVTEGNTVNKPTNPTNDEYGTFENWYDNAERTGSPFNFTNPITGNITLHAKWNATYAIGATGPGGGIIFYRSEIGFTMIDDNSKAHFLEAANSNMASLLTWGKITPGYITPGTGNSIGMGRSNTAIILNYDTNAAAAKACRGGYNAGGSKTDWFLPSRDELTELYKQKSLFTSWGSGNASVYWTSSAYDVSYAWCRSFSTGNEGTEKRDTSTYSVRAIRAF